MRLVAGKLLSLSKMGYTHKVNTDIKEQLYKISANYETCSEYASPPSRFREAIPKDNVVFDREIEM